MKVEWKWRGQHLNKHKVRNSFHSTILFQRNSSAMLNGDPDNGKELTGSLTHFNNASKSKGAESSLCCIYLYEATDIIPQRF